MKIRCPKCNALYRISSKKIPPQGARATCKTCGARFEIPGGMVTAPVPREVSETDRFAREQRAAQQQAQAASQAVPQTPPPQPSVPLAPASTQGMPADAVFQRAHFPYNSASQNPKEQAPWF